MASAMPALHVPIDRGKPLSLARQIQAHLERLIQERLLAPGAKLPATRELARDLGVNRGTVALAYDELVAAGWVRARVGQGTFVAQREGGAAMPAAPAIDAATVDWQGLLSRGAQIVAGDAQRQRLSAVPASPAHGLVSFAGGMPDSGLFPTDAFRRALNRVVHDEGQELLQYYPLGGYPPLRRFLATYLLRVGIEARTEEILVVNGSQQGFDLIARTLLDPGDAVAIEQPTYPRAIQVFRSFDAQLLPVPLGADGLQLGVLDRGLERWSPKFLYVQPSAHNPTGLTWSVEARRRLLDTAARHRLPIVEDGFDPSLYFGQRPPAALKALDTRGLVMYVGTFSKILFPGLRLGWVVAPAPLLERLEAAKELADIQTSALLQAAVHHFCQRRVLERHLARVAAEYGRRRRRLLESLAERMPKDVTWTEPRGGFSLLVALPDSLDATALLPRAVARGVSFTPGPAFYVERGGEHRLRLSFSAVPLARIDEGVRRLSEVIRDARRRADRPVAGERVAVPLV